MAFRARTRVSRCLTPSQTVGPFLAIALRWPDGPDVVGVGTPGAIRVVGRLLDGAGAPVTDGLVETWQADAHGRFDHPDDPRGAAAPYPAGFRGFGRSETRGGEYAVRTVKPGPTPARGGGWEAPHLALSVFARGLQDRVVTRLYFADEREANDADPVLAALPSDRRATLLAAPEPGGYRLDIRLQGEHESVFFDL